MSYTCWCTCYFAFDTYIGIFYIHKTHLRRDTPRCNGFLNATFYMHNFTPSATLTAEEDDLLFPFPRISTRRFEDMPSALAHSEYVYHEIVYRCSSRRAQFIYTRNEGGFLLITRPQLA